MYSVTIMTGAKSIRSIIRNQRKNLTHLHTRFLAPLLLYQVTMLGYFGVKKFHFTPILIPLPIITLLFAFICCEKFYRFFQCTALEVASNELTETPDMELVYKSFVPPCLKYDLLDNDHYIRDV